jgi:tetratricopeptide (TPR) repeat protein
MRTASPKLDLSHLTANERALFRCQTALAFKDKGDYDGAQEVMRPLWKGVGERPETTGLHPSVAAEVLLSAGILTGWIGSKNEVKEANDTARDLITESITFYESAGDVTKVAAARAELAYCYWRAGALDEARIMFTEALQKLTTEGNTRANALFGLSVVEWSAARYIESLRILTDNATLFKRITNHTTKGAYHLQLAMVLRKLAAPENKAAQFRRVLNEHEEADRQFKLAHNTVFRAHVKNNIGNVLRELSRFKEAHEYLDHARRLTASVKDKVKTAQVDESRAQLFLAERRYAQAESAARNAARTFEKSGHQCFLTEALITHGIALARLKQTERAQFTFQKAIEVAHQAGALNIAGLAALTLIEEVDQLSPDTLSYAYERAGEWLADCQSQELLLRFKAAGKKLALELRSEPKAEGSTDLLFNKGCRLPEEVLRFERALISQTLAKVNGSVTHAARLLGVSYQRLGYILDTRHKDLLKERTPVRRRSRRDQ